MKKIILALAVVVLAILTVFVNGCETSEENLLKPDMCCYLEDGTRIECDRAYKFFYVVDKTNGAVYICFKNTNSYSAGITAAINPDGTHMTVDQLKEIYKHNGTW